MVGSAIGYNCLSSVPSLDPNKIQEIKWNKRQQTLLKLQDKILEDNRHKEGFPTTVGCFKIFGLVLFFLSHFIQTTCNTELV